MAFKVFISHSTSDLDPVYQFKHWLEMNGIQTYVAELYPQPGTQLPAKIENGINWSDCLIAIMTKDGDRSAWVNQEIGYAKKANKLIVPVVEEGVDLKGFLKPLEYVAFKKESPEFAISQVVNYLVKVKANKEQQDNLKAGLLILFGILALVAASKE
jgi:hypothetical protein